MANLESSDKDSQLCELEEEKTFDEDTQEELSGERHIFTEKSDPTFSDLHARYREGDLILAPEFQRREVWDATRESRLIESVLLEVPLPVVYLAEEKNGKEEVIDGQQRLNAIFRYLDNKFSFKGLKALQELNGKGFKDLEKRQQKFIQKYAIRTVTFKKESDENLRFDIFERLNTGAIPLNDQELRMSTGKPADRLGGGDQFGVIIGC